MSLNEVKGILCSRRSVFSVWASSNSFATFKRSVGAPNRCYAQLLTEVKTEESTSPVGTSSLDNNNSIEKNLNSIGSSQTKENHVEVVKDSEQQKKRNTTPKILRSLRSQQQQQQVSKCNDKAAEKNPQTQSTETSLTRWLRSRQSADSSAVDIEEFPIGVRKSIKNSRQ
ncbi:uncharacterized protein LOC143893337 [Temnothorax americanus]|uniref:uncharacterized protein LOC143893337 n=1 Tax=Temnothorax americanus TaxID=1964332 RepID=UPI004067C565